ncbi:hypothetical protein MTP39_09205 [Faecalibacterium sp. I3-3-33]|uniref:hypothetical protein n=1 Tax=Faecalibacterium sp. I3-3-33 TaxID=2929492 RepID=UPI002014E454|nr:hypothetical protein [Faecalibacterium sp. I3-3-33]UQK44760.1 hypothetical protein MTP39_09205 [Faecalibacterium sp. I3-3-33]
MIRIGPVISTRKKHYTEMCGAFLFAEAGFLGAALLRLHRFQAFAGGSYTTPNF